MRGRRFAAAALATLGLLLLPVTVVVAWVTTELTSTERVVAALAPVVDDPEVQDRLILEVIALVEDQVDIDAVTADLVAALGDALGVGDRAQASIDLLSESLAAGVRGLIAQAVDEVVRSPAVSAAWQRSLEVVHGQSIRLLVGADDSVLTLDRDGTLRLPLGPIVAEVRAELVDEGVPFAASIPDTDRSLVLAELPNLALARVVYQAGITVGFLLPWLTAGLLVAAALLSSRRPAMVRTLGVLAAAVAVVLLVGIATLRAVVVSGADAVSAALLEPFFDALAWPLVASAGGVLLLALFAVVAGWYAGTSRRAERTRHAVAEACDRITRPLRVPVGRETPRMLD